MLVFGHAVWLLEHVICISEHAKQKKKNNDSMYVSVHVHIYMHACSHATVSQLKATRGADDLKLGGASQLRAECTADSLTHTHTQNILPHCALCMAGRGSGIMGNETKCERDVETCLEKVDKDESEK